MFQILTLAAIAIIQPSLVSPAITPDVGCGITKGCYPATCPLSGCTDFHLSWEHNGDFMDFKLVASVQQSGTQWAAVGFSFDSLMPNASVVLCRIDTKSAEIGHTAAVGRSYSALKTTEKSLQNASSSVVGNYLKCLFSRIKKPVEFTDQIFALDGNSFYILNAEGLIVNGLPTGHLSRGSSPAPVSLMDIGQLTTDDTPTLPSIVPTGIPVPISTLKDLPTISAATQNTVPLIFMACLHLIVTLV